MEEKKISKNELDIMIKQYLENGDIIKLCKEQKNLPRGLRCSPFMRTRNKH